MTETSSIPQRSVWLSLCAAVLLFGCSANAFVVSPLGGPRHSTTVAPLAEGASSSSSSSSSSWSSHLSTQPNAEKALSELIQNTNPEGSPDVAFLFVGVHHAGRFERLVQLLHDTWPETQVVASVGGGVIGSREEVDQPGLPGMTLLSGKLPEGASVDVFKFNELSNQPPPPNATFWNDMLQSPSEEERVDDSDMITTRVPSFLLFADPWSPWETVLKGLGTSRSGSVVIAGGISVAVSPKPTVALNGEALPQGSMVGVRFTGTLGLQTVTSQGCRPVGPVFEITNCTGNTILELNGLPAIEQLDHVAKNTKENDKLLMRNNGYLCGVATNHGTQHHQHPDFLVRQIVGFKPDKGGLVVSPAGENNVKLGDKVSFHVRDGPAAESDLRLMVERVRTERLFLEQEQKGQPVAALQFSCTARGQALFGKPNVDLGMVRKLMGYPQGHNEEDNDEEDKGPAVAGFFANGEFGPVGIGGLKAESGKKKKQQSKGRTTFLHGFTTVVTMLCDYSEVPVPELPISDNVFATIEESASAWQ